MALNHAKLPAPLRLRPVRVQPLSHHAAASKLSSFLQDDASHLLSGSGAVRASILRLVQGLNDELAAAKPAPVLTSAAAHLPESELDPLTKKRRKTDADKGSKKRRKVDA
ncbi:hypothetical protein JCM8208_007006 [Rhodotorula glutinis]